jgi:uncharacterized protein YdaU (DUF1376 family)
MSLQREATPEGAMGFMPFYYQRFTWSTRGWPASAAYAYLLLLCEQYAAGSLDADPERLEEISPGTVEHWERIKRKFDVGPDGRLRNRRCEEIRAKSVQAGERKRESARNAAAKRWHTDGNATAMRPHSERNATAMRNHANDNDNESDIENEIEIGSESNSETHTLNGSAVEPVSSVNDPKPNRRATIPQAALDALWQRFPRKVGRKKAMALLDKAVREVMEDFEHDEPTDAIIWMEERIDALAKEHKTTDPKFIPHPATWLGQGRYLDPVETP